MAIAAKPDGRPDFRGWVQTGLVIVSTLAAGLLAFSRLDARADAAVRTADRAETKAGNVEADVRALRESLSEQKVELVRIRTVLEERLPKADPPR